MVTSPDVTTNRLIQLQLPRLSWLHIKTKDLFNSCLYKPRPVVESAQFDMPAQQVLPGACACGRNRYVILMPADVNDAAEVLFGNSSDDSGCLIWAKGTIIALKLIALNLQAELIRVSYQPSCEFLFHGFGAPLTPTTPTNLILQSVVALLHGMLPTQNVTSVASAGRRSPIGAKRTRRRLR